MTTFTAEESGREAERPSAIGLIGWWDIAWRTWRGVNDDSLLMVARSIAFSIVMALFPSLAAFVSLYGIFADASKARDHLALLVGVVPADALTLIGDEMVRIAEGAEANLSLTFAVGLVLAFWAASTGMKALIRGLNIAYEEQERRGFVKLSWASLAMTIAAFAFALVTTGALLVVPLALRLIGASGEALSLGELRWPGLFLLSVLALELLYRYGPCRARARWRWLSWGSVLASILWLGGSLVFSWYVTAFSAFSATYGSLGAVFGFLTWSWLCAGAVLLGAKLNAEIEHQTTRDSTVGPPRPMGRRGAVVADTEGRPAGLAPWRRVTAALRKLRIRTGARRP